jgi:hypothetical protein
MTKLKFKRPVFDGMFYKSKEVALPITIWMKYRPSLHEYDFHIDIDPKYQKLGLGPRAIEAIANQFYNTFGTLVISEARILNPAIFKILNLLKNSKIVKVKYNKHFSRYEITPK